MNILEISERKMNAVGTLQERTIGRGVGMAKYEVVGVSESYVLKESFLQTFCSDLRRVSQSNLHIVRERSFDIVTVSSLLCLTEGNEMTSPFSYSR